MRRSLLVAALVLVIVASLATGQEPHSFVQTQTDDYTRYELLEPESGSFRIFYDVSATTAGARYYFNGIRVGSQPTVHAVYDLHTGDSLPWQIVSGQEARALGMQNARDAGEYIAVTLARPVPDSGQVRLRIDKTYRDTASYGGTADGLLFERSLGIKRNAVVLPPGYELTAANYPVQVAVEADGRLKASFMNRGSSAVPLVIEGRRLPKRTPRRSRISSPPPQPQTTTRLVPLGARVDYDFSERAYQDRDIVYFLQQPETHSFRLYHDYTETRPGVGRYLNVVRAGSKATNPSAVLLDTGEPLRVETLRGDQLAGRGIDVGTAVTAETEVVAIWFDPVTAGESVRLRITETYTDPSRYLLVGNELIWDRSFGRPRNTVVLPSGWYLTANAVPAVVSTTTGGRIRLHYINDRPGSIDVFIKAERR